MFPGFSECNILHMIEGKMKLYCIHNSPQNEQSGKLYFFYILVMKPRKISLKGETNGLFQLIKKVKTKKKVQTTKLSIN